MLELFGVSRLLGSAHNGPTDTRYLIQMINAAELPKSATTRWLWYIHMFDLRLTHVPADKHVAVDGLSRRRPTEENTDEEDAEEWLDHTFGASIHSRVEKEEDEYAKVFLIQENCDEGWRVLGRYLETEELGEMGETAPRKLRAKALLPFCS